MTAKHTAGPWVTYKHSDTPEMIAVLAEADHYDSDSNPTINSGFDLADCFGPDRDANARLIAAAPELLAVVHRLLREDAEGDYTIGLIEDARAAIAKATGGAQ